MEKTIQDLTDLSGVDERLGGSEAAPGSLAELARRRIRLRKKIPGLLLASYDALARTGRRPIVVPLLNAHCTGCRLRLPPQLDSSIRRHRILCPCPYCHRLLYAPVPGTHGEKSAPRTRTRATRGRNAGIDHIN